MAAELLLPTCLSTNKKKTHGGYSMRRIASVGEFRIEYFPNQQCCQQLHQHC